MITIDGHTLKEFGMFALQGHDHPLTPAFAERTLFIPNRPGLIHFGTTPRDRQFTIPVGIIEYDKLIKQQKVRDLVNILFDAYGKPKEVKLTFDYDPDKFYKVKVNERLNFERLVHAGEAELVFTAYDPFAYSLVDNSEGITWGSEEITFSYTYLFGNDDPGTANETITGNTTINATVTGLALRPIFSISGSASNVTFSANGKSFSLPSFSNADYTIDGERYTVIKNGNNGMSDMTGDFLELLPGDNDIDITGSGMNFELSIKYRDKFM